MLYNQKSKETEKVRDFVRCQIGSCHGGAMAVAGKSNVCREHYDNFYTNEALKWNSAMGLIRADIRLCFREDCRGFSRENSCSMCDFYGQELTRVHLNDKNRRVHQ